jgi:hypothetical protein
MSSLNNIDKKYNIVIYASFIILAIGLIYVMNKQNNLSSLITTGPGSNTAKIPSTSGLYSYSPAYGSWYGDTLTTLGSIAWRPNTDTNIVPVGITYWSEPGTFTFTSPGVYKVSFNSYETVNPAIGNAHNYCVAIFLNGITISETICSSNNSPVSNPPGIVLSSNFIPVNINHILRITKNTDFISFGVTNGGAPDRAYLSIHWIGL